MPRIRGCLRRVPTRLLVRLGEIDSGRPVRRSDWPGLQDELRTNVRSGVSGDIKKKLGE